MSARRGSLPALLGAMLPLAILLLALGLRLHAIDAQSLWNDEGTSVAVAERDLATIARDAAGDIHPPLYYWLLAGWQRLTGSSEFSVRSLSALLGVALVALVYSLGRVLQPAGAGPRSVAPAAAAVAAISPFLVVYAQEARMYTLLALWAALAFYAALRWLATRPGERSLAWGLVYVFAAAAGLYTHYAFPLVLVAANLVVLLAFALRLGGGRGETWQRVGLWLALQAGVLLLYAPWLPVAYRQLGTWPGVDEPVQLLPALARVTQILATGPAAAPWHDASWLLLLLLLVYFPRRSGRLEPAVAGAAPVVWLVVPVALILALGLYKEAYLKFLIVVSPAYCLLVGRLLGGTGLVRRAGERVLATLVGLLVVSAALYGLRNYYTDPAYARDDYRSMAAYLEAVGRPGDAVVLNAPGQQEVFAYYYDGDLPVYPLPQDRPADPAATEAALAALARPGGRVFALLWATGESDPGRLVEGWLEEHAYKALDSWYGNVRLAAYAVPAAGQQAPARELDVPLEDPETGQSVTLLGYSQLSSRVSAGDIAQITLFWQAAEVLDRRYKVFVHLLDEASHVVGQRDSEPGGGALPTTLWEPGQVVRDNYGLPIHPATPPGSYRVYVGLYDGETARLL